MARYVFMSLMLLSFGVSHAEELSVTFATGEWVPYTSQHMPEYGAATELVSAICRAADIRPEYVFVPWKRAEIMAEKGDVFAAFPFVVTDERKERFVLSDILFYGVNRFVYYSKNPKIVHPEKYVQIEDLKGYTVGLVLGFFAEEELRKAGITIDLATCIDNSIRQLALGRIDFFLEEQTVTYHAVKRLFPHEVDNFRSLPTTYGEERPNYLLVSRNYPGSEMLVQRFNDGLQHIRNSGEYDRILGKYNMSADGSPARNAD